MILIDSADLQIEQTLAAAATAEGLSGEHVLRYFYGGPIFGLYDARKIRPTTTRPQEWPPAMLAVIWDPERECEGKGVTWAERVHTMRDLLQLLRSRSKRRREVPELEECYRLTGAG